jgi:hypothetical protein
MQFHNAKIVRLQSAIWRVFLLEEKMQEFLNARDKSLGIPLRARTHPRSAKAIIALCKRKGVGNLTTVESAELSSRAILTDRSAAARSKWRRSLRHEMRDQARLSWRGSSKR